MLVEIYVNSCINRLNVDKYQINIDKNLSQLRDGIKILEKQLSDEEQTGAR
jgi:syntaxin 8